MNFFPSRTRKFTLLGDPATAMERLKRRTGKSENLLSRYTDKSFLGRIEGNQFKLITSKVGSGAFCVMEGEVNGTQGHIKVQIHLAFRILLSIILSYPFIAVLLLNKSNPDPVWVRLLQGVIPFLVIRFIIELVFWFVYKESLKRLADVLDCEWEK